MTIDQEFIEYIVKALVNKPDQVRVERVIDEKGVLLTLHVDDEDLGRVIGKRGLTAQSLRTLLRALGSKSEAHYNLRIADGKPQPQATEAPSEAEPAPEKEEEASDDEEVDETDSRLSQTKQELDDLDDDLEI